MRLFCKRSVCTQLSVDSCLAGWRCLPLFQSLDYVVDAQESQRLQGPCTAQHLERPLATLCNLVDHPFGKFWNRHLPCESVSEQVISKELLVKAVLFLLFSDDILFL